MVISSLARKVFEQTDIPEIVDWAWWVEKRLQTMQINGLVKMIQRSSKLEPSYIDGYLQVYKWSYRKSEASIFIDEHRWLYEDIQILQTDFPWGMWSELVKVDPCYSNFFTDSLYIAINRGHQDLNYVLAIYRDKVRNFEIKQKERQERLADLEDLEEGYVLSDDVKKEWNDLKEYL